jgi:hypothetical protein
LLPLLFLHQSPVCVLPGSAAAAPALWRISQAAGVALAKLAKAEKVTSAGLALLAPPAGAAAAAAASKLTTGEVVGW